MSSWTQTTYSIWFDPKMDWEATSSGRRGRQQTYSAAAIQACLILNVLSGLPLRQTTGFVESLFKLVGLNWSVPDFSTLCRRQKTLSVAIPYRDQQDHFICLWTAQASRLKVKASGTLASMEAPNAAYGARST